MERCEQPFSNTAPLVGTRAAVVGRCLTSGETVRLPSARSGWNAQALVNQVGPSPGRSFPGPASFRGPFLKPAPDSRRSISQKSLRLPRSEPRPPGPDGCPGLQGDGTRRRRAPAVREGPAGVCRGAHRGCRPQPRGCCWARGSGVLRQGRGEWSRSSSYERAPVSPDRAAPDGARTGLCREGVHCDDAVWLARSAVGWSWSEDCDALVVGKSGARQLAFFGDGAPYASSRVDALALSLAAPRRQQGPGDFLGPCFVAEHVRGAHQRRLAPVSCLSPGTRQPGVSTQLVRGADRPGPHEVDRPDPHP